MGPDFNKDDRGSFDDKRHVGERLPLKPCVVDATLEVIQRHVKHLTTAMAQPAMHSKMLDRVEEQLSRLGIEPTDSMAIASSVPLRCLAGQIIASAELQNSIFYGLNEFSTVLARHTQAVDALFSRPMLASTLGLAVAAPTLYYFFHQQRDSLALGAVTSALLVKLSPESFDSWQNHAATSLLLGYRDAVQSPNPANYAHSTQLRAHSFVSDSPSIEESIAHVFRSLITSNEGIPLAWWELPDFSLRQKMCASLLMTDAMSWMNESLGKVAAEAARIQERIKKCNDEAQGDATDESTKEVAGDSPNRQQLLIERDFEGVRSGFMSACRFFLLYIEGKRGNLDGDFKKKLKPKKPEDCVEQQEVPTSYEIRSTNLLVQRSLAKQIHSAMKAICDCFAQPDVETKCPSDLALAVTEMLTEIDFYFDEEGDHPSKSLYRTTFLDAFDRALQQGDLGSATAIRMLFPLEDREHPKNRRYLIDEHIEEKCTAEIARQLMRESKLLMNMFSRVEGVRGGTFPREIEARLGILSDMLKHFPLARIMQDARAELVRPAAHLIRSLLRWDAQEDQADSFDWNLKSESEQLFIGCRKAAEILLLYRDPDLRCKIMGAALEQPVSRQLGVLANFIARSNKALSEALEALAQGRSAPDQILDSCAAAFIAHRLHGDSIRYRNFLPLPIVDQIPLLVKVGHEIEKNQQLLFTPPEGLPCLHFSDLRVFEMLNHGLTGNKISPRRHNLLISFLRAVQENDGIITVRAHPLIFESISEYAFEFIDIAKQGVTAKKFHEEMAVILAGFLHPPAEVAPRLLHTFACRLAQLFDMSHATRMFTDRTHSVRLADELRELAKEVMSSCPREALRKFRTKPAINALLKDVGLAATDEQRP